MFVYSNDIQRLALHLRASFLPLIYRGQPTENMYHCIDSHSNFLIPSVDVEARTLCPIFPACLPLIFCLH